jgi:hypothetical protein
MTSGASDTSMSTGRSRVPQICHRAFQFVERVHVVADAAEDDSDDVAHNRKSTVWLNRCQRP